MTVRSVRKGDIKILYCGFYVSVFFFTPPVIATIVFIVFAVRYAKIRKFVEQSDKEVDKLAAAARSMRVAGIVALTLWVLLAAFNGLLYIAVRNM